MSYDTEARLRAIAANAVREAMLVYNRWDKPFLDDDAARIETIFGLLHLQEMNASEYEHAPLTVANQPAVSSALPKISDLLAKADAVEDRAPKAAEIAIPRQKPRDAAA